MKTTRPLGLLHLLIATLVSDNRLQALCPVGQGIHVGLVGKLSELFAVLFGEPCHVDNRQISPYVEYVESKLESVPWSFKPIRVDIAAWRSVSQIGMQESLSRGL